MKQNDLFGSRLLASAASLKVEVDAVSSPMRHLERLRLERAMQLLRLSTHNLYDLAAAVGFCDAKHFSRRFHAIVGMTPSDYRRSAGK